MLHGKIPSEIVSKRQQYLNSMKRFVEEQKTKLQDGLTKLGLQLHHLKEVEPKQVCPYDKNHVVPERAFKKHTRKCRLVSAGFQNDEMEAQLQNLDFAYEGKDSILKIEIDEKNLNKIIWDSCAQTGQVYTGHRSMPVSHIDESINLTADDRLALYHHVVKTSHEAGKVLSVDRNDDLLTTDWSSLVKKGLLDEQNNKEYGSKLEQLAALRDMKRRRQSYRAKNVHITKKSYTEIIREVIVNQMEILTPDDRRNIKKETLSSTQGESNRDLSEDQHSERGSSSYQERDGSRGSKRGRRERERSQERPAWRSSGDRHGSYSGDSSRRSGFNSDRPRVSDTSDNFDMEIIKTEPEDSVTAGEIGFSRASYSRRREDDDLGPPKHKRSRNQSPSPSHSDSSDSRSSRHKKSKKSKHKKKHSKKHKRKD